MKLEYIQFHTRTNDTGSLSFFEEGRDIPFAIKRMYYIYGVSPGARRGFHAHKHLQQVLFAIHGSCKLLLDDGSERTIVTLDAPDRGLLLRGVVWREMYDFSPGAVLLVLASEYYDESDYIRDYGAFLDYVKESECKR
jgi:hypothetical protein